MPLESSKVSEMTCGLSFQAEYEKALRIATKAHDGQVSMTGEDYIMHPITVSGYCFTERAKIAALLHDVVEDTDVTLDDLRKAGFAEDIVTAVDCVSKRDGEERKDYFVRVASDDIALEVKFADMRHNGSRWPADRPKEEAEWNFNKYHKRARKLLKMVGEERAKRSMTEETYKWVTGSRDQ
jgi:(p)ppGpp synthase/HD superfamily hydrolase